MRTLGKAVVPTCIAVLLVWASPLHAKIMNSTGTWKLNLEKSHSTAKGPAPKSGMLKVVHNEPAYKYSYTETAADGKTNTSEWEGTIDGKPQKEKDGATTTLKRIDDSTLEGTSISADGKTTETSTWVVSKDGKVGTYKSTSKGPEGEVETLLVFEKQ
jgi:hypothetical protein